jgi:hypothetical protein
MPYIAEERRRVLDGPIEDLQKALSKLTAGGLSGSEGDLNYAISRLVAAKFLAEPRYYTIARVTGVLANVKDEFYRRLGIPYENVAIGKNGDVPEFARIEALAEATRREAVAEVVTGQE